MPTMNLTINLTADQLTAAQGWAQREGVSAAGLASGILLRALDGEVERQGQNDLVARARQLWLAASPQQQAAALAALQT